VDTAQLEQRLAHLLRNWQDDLRELLISRHGEATGLRLASGYGRALPAGYIEEVSPELAANDVEHMAALSGPGDLRLSLQHVRRAGWA
jgi:glutamate dehydrogenase